MDIYAKVKYNKPGELTKVVNAAFENIGDTKQSESDSPA